MFVAIFSISCVLIFAIMLHFVVLHYRKFGRTIDLLPGPRAIPLMGNLYVYYGSPSKIWKRQRQIISQYYPIYRFWDFMNVSVGICHPDDIEKIISNPRLIQKSDVYKFLEPWFNTGLLTSSGRKWHLRRKILTPAFHFNMLQQFMNIFTEEGKRLIQTLQSEGGSVVKDLRYLTSEHTLNVICESAMGVSLRDKGHFQYKYRKAVHDMGELVLYRLVRPWFYYTTVFFNLTLKGKEQSRVLQILHGFTRKIIQERKEYHDQTNDRYLSDSSDNANAKEDDLEVFGIRKKRLAMLDLLIAAHRRNEIDDEGIREEVDTFMFEGHDTTAVALIFTIMLLAEHPEIQEKARAEVEVVMQECAGKLNMSILQKLTYLERCIKESLRLYPSVHFISRAPETDVTLSGYVIPANTMVHVHIFEVHRDPRFWSNPEVFDPDRFLPENSQGRHPYCYIPFSAGPRNCIGQRFAMMELKTTLSLLLHNFRFKPVDLLKDVTFTADLVLRSVYSLRTKFIPLQH